MIHVAVLMRPYLELILDGTKTVECRLTQQARAPYKAIERGDRIYFKESAGPYRCVATADEVLFESNLTPPQVAAMKRDYNELICGNDDFWNWKRSSRFGTLIWLKDVRPSDAGPAIPPLQGAAWRALDEEIPWRRVDDWTHSFSVEITPGNLRNNTLYATSVIDRFPPSAIGGATHSEAGRPLTLALHGGPVVRTDIVGPRKLFRSRIWGRWLNEYGAQPGDRVVFTPSGRSRFDVGLWRAPARSRRPIG